MITKKTSFIEAKNIIEKHKEKQTYASVTNLTTEVKNLKKELEQFKKLNEALILRVKVAKQFPRNKEALNKDIIQTNQTTILTNQTNTAQIQKPNSAADMIFNRVLDHKKKIVN